MVGFGLSKLFKEMTNTENAAAEANASNEHAAEQTADEFDFDIILGRSENGMWLAIENKTTKTDDRSVLTGCSPSDNDNEPKAKKARKSLEHSSEITDDKKLYEFEGVDYATTEQDLQILQQLHNENEQQQKLLLESGRTARSRNPRTFDDADQLPTIGTKQRRTESKQVRDARKVEREQTRRSADSYSGNALLEPAFVDGRIVESDDDSQGDCDEDDDRLQLVIGDVTKPAVVGNRVIVICVDTSGEWSERGVFAAVSSLSNLPEQYYEKAAEEEGEISSEIT